MEWSDPEHGSAAQAHIQTFLVRNLLSHHLSGYITLADSNNFDIKSAIPLNLPDVEISSVVSNLIAHASPKPIIPPAAFEKAVFDEPLRSSSAPQRGIEQTHDEADRQIVEELTGRVYYDVRGFPKQYFEGKTWTNKVGDIYKKSTTQCAEGHWSGWPEPVLRGHF
ncbi:MAG: hypothetical protein M1813_001754 [Trichoglossum hirsutum]|nr:MAG: hypothetical protein M1813_001754 [Trichoglossum hirsutum]